MIDGDTVVLDVDVGFRMRAEMPIRLKGINTPEMKDQAGKDAKRWVIGWFAEHPEVELLTFKDPEKYGRWLGIISPEGHPEITLNAALLQAGIAAPFMV